MIHSISKKNQNIFIIMFIVMYLLITKGMKFSGWSLIPLSSTLRYCVLFILPIYTVYASYQKHKYNSKMYNKKTFKYFIYACIISFLLRNIFYDRGLGYGLESNLFVSFMFCSYFIFNYLRISESVLLKSITIIGLIAFCIQVFQQINPNLAMFSMYTEEMRDEMELSSDYITGQRNGLYRFIPIAVNIPVFLVCYYFSKVVSDFKLIYLLLACAFLVSMYLMLTRMFIVSTVISCIYILFSLNNVKKSKIGIIVVLLGIVIISIFYSDYLFSNLFSSNESDIDYSSKARLDCIPFLLKQAIDNPLLLIFGHGYPGLLWKWGANFGYWYNDIGIIGQIYTYGLIWIFVYLKIVYWLLVKMKRNIPLYIRGYMFGMFCICYMMPTYANSLESTLLWCIILYISDLYMNKSKQTENNVI